MKKVYTLKFEQNAFNGKIVGIVVADEKLQGLREYAESIGYTEITMIEHELSDENYNEVLKRDYKRELN